ncbi:CENP-C_C domain-containing protein [Trichonephila clavipes]|nr:CENP-C_C domain-containing protein [Trichonephila clavipes]
MKGKRKSTSSIDRRSSLRLRLQKDGTHELSTILPDQRDNRVAEARGWSPKKRALNQKDIESSVKKIKKIKCDSISESILIQFSCSVADVLKSRRHSSVAILPILESPQTEKSFLNVNKTLNTSVKRSQRHKKSTPKKEVLYAKSAKQSLIKKNIDIVDLSSDSSSEKSPADEEVSTSERDSSAKERQIDESQELTNIMNSNFRTFLDLISSELREGRTAIPKEAFAQERLPCKTTRITPTLIKGVRQEKSPSKPEKSPVTTVATNEEAVKESHGDALDIRESSPFLPDPRNKIVSKRREWTSDSFSGGVKDIKRVVTRKIPRPSSNLVITKAEIHNEEGKLRRKPSDSKKIHLSKTGTEQFQFKKQPCIFYGPDTIEVLESIEIPERESVLEDPSMKRKRPRVTVDNFEPEESPFEPEASVTESETSPKKMTQVTGDQLNHSRQKNLFEKAKAPKNKRAAPIDSNEIQSDFGENSIAFVKRKGNGITVSGNNRHPCSPTKRTHEKLSNDVVANGNLSVPTNGLRRSSRYRVPPLDIWRNERLVFETLPSGEVKCKIDKGTEADNYGIETILKKQKARKMKQQKKEMKNVTETPILNAVTGEIERTVVHRHFQSLQWAAPPNEEKTYHLAKTFTSESKSFGFIDVFPFSTKEKQYSPVHNLHFVVVKGHLEVTIQDTSFTFTVGDSWIVPVDVPYSITNCSRHYSIIVCLQKVSHVFQNSSNGSGVTENISTPLQAQDLDPKPKYVLSVSQALGALRNAGVCVTPLPDRVNNQTCNSKEIILNDILQDQSK